METTQRMTAYAVGVGASACAVAGAAGTRGSAAHIPGSARPRTLGTTTFTDNPTGPRPEPPV